MKLLICFSGQIGSGKSSVSKAVAQKLGWKRAGFGDYLREEIKGSGGDPTSRKALQDLGEHHVRTDPVNFCRAVLAFGGFMPGENFVIDGLRHNEILRILTRLAKPSKVRLLFLEATERTRAVRVAIRDNELDLLRIQAHHVEAELQEDLRKHADLVVNAGQPIEEVVAKCLEAIVKWR